MTIFQCLQRQGNIALGGHQAELVAAAKAVFHINGQPVVVGIDDVAHQLFAAQL